MGRNNKKYRKTLQEQAYCVLVSKQAFGESKKQDRASGTNHGKIYSVNTYHTYKKQTGYFCKWVNRNHPECTTLKKAKQYIPDWLKEKETINQSAWTIQTASKALNILYDIAPGDPDYYVPPKRNRNNIKRSRMEAERDAHFSQAKNRDLVVFARGTGCRRSELEKMRKDDLWTRENIHDEINKLSVKESTVLSSPERQWLGTLQDALNFEGVNHFLYIKGKGGRVRLAPIVGLGEKEIVDRIESTEDGQKVWLYVSSNADIHSYRGDYASRVYKKYARDIDAIPFDKIHPGTGKKYQSDVYHCRKDQKGKKLDKAAMLMASKALGHNRISVVADNYLYKL